MRDDLQSFLEVAQATVAGFPAPFRKAAEAVLIQVTDWPDQDVCAEMGIDDPLELTGLYDGVPMTEKTLSDPSPYPDQVWLFREPILTEWRERGNVALDALVAHVTVHEFAHHFGWSDDEIAEIDPWWE